MSKNWLFYRHQSLLPFPPCYALSAVGKVTYSLLPGPEHHGTISMARDRLAGKSHVKITVSHTGGHTLQKGSWTAHLHQASGKEKAGEPCREQERGRETQDHAHVNRQSHPAVTGVEGFHPSKHITHSGNPLGVWGWWDLNMGWTGGQIT